MEFWHAVYADSPEVGWHSVFYSKKGGGGGGIDPQGDTQYKNCQ